jgi:predicted nucleic acid-binding Zn ribbon protein
VRGSTEAPSSPAELASESARSLSSLPRVCLYCGAPVLSTRRRSARFCSPRCRAGYSRKLRRTELLAALAEIKGAAARIRALIAADEEKEESGA